MSVTVRQRAGPDRCELRTHSINDLVLIVSKSIEISRRSIFHLTPVLVGAVVSAIQGGDDLLETNDLSAVVNDKVTFIDILLSKQTKSTTPSLRHQRDFTSPHENMFKPT